MTEASGTAAFRADPIAPGLHFVATPIGAARDITLHALDVLAAADVLVAEDTRVLRHLMEIHGVPLGGRRIVAYHDRNGAAQRPGLMRRLAEGASVAYASDAGTPLVADPGYRLAEAAIAAGHEVHAVPGPSAALAALTLSGLPTDRFLFAGFPPARSGARGAWLDEVLAVPATVVIFEAPRRAGALLRRIVEAGHGGRRAAFCREITKRFEEVRRASVADLAEALEGAAPKGESVIVLAPPDAREVAEDALRATLADALERQSLKRAVAEVATRTGARKRDVYQLALEMKGGDDAPGDDDDQR